MHLVLLIACISVVVCSPISDKNDETDGEISRKILGSSVVTSVSVVMETGNGKHTYYSDAIGQPIHKVHIASQVASPINLLNPDRYEFYTFNDNGELVKRLMTIDEIQGIIAGGDVDNLNYNNEYSQMMNPDNDVSDIVENVQNVLKEEIESHKYSPDTIPLLDTPDVSQTWDTILPAVFGDNLAMPEIYDSTEKSKETTTLEKTTEDIYIETMNKLSSLSFNNIQQYEDTNQRNKITPPYFQPVSSTEKLQENISTTNTENIELFTQPAEQNKINDSIVETIDLPKQTELVSVITRPVTQVTENVITSSSHLVTINTIQNTTIKPTLNQVGISTSIVNIEELKNAPLPLSTTPQPITTTPQSITTTPQPITTTPQPITTTQLKNNEEQFSIITNTTPLISITSSSLIIELQPIKNITEDLPSGETFLPSTTQNTNELNSDKLNTLSTDQNEIYTTDSILPNLNELIANISNQFSTENIDIQPYNVTNEIQNILNNNNLNMSDNLQQVVTLASSLLELNDFTTEISSITLEENISTSNINNQIKSSENFTTEQIFTEVYKISETNMDLTTPDTITTEKIITTTLNDEIVTDMKPIFLFNPQQATTEKHTTQNTVTSQPNTNKINEKNDEQVLVTDTTKFSQLEKDKMNISTEPYIQISFEDTTLTNNQPLQVFEETTTEIYSTKSDLLSDENITTIKEIETTMKLIENSTEVMEKSTLLINDETTTEGLTEKSTNEYIENITQKFVEKITKITETTTDKMSEANTEENTLFTTEEILKTTTEVTTSKSIDAIEENTTKVPITLKLTDPTTQKTIQVFTENITQEPIQKTTSTKEDKTTQTTIKEFTQVSTEKTKTLVTQNISDISTENTTQDYLIKLPSITTLSSITTTEKQLETTEKQELLTSKLNNTNKQEPYRKTDESYHLNKVSTTDTWKLVQTVLPPNSNQKKNETSTTTTTEKLNIELYQPTLKIDMSSQGTFGMPDLSEDIFMFSKLYNELALKFWNALSVNDISTDRSVVISPFGAISVLAMIFLGARGGTSGEMNDLLKLDDVVTFNPHLTFKEVTDSIISRKALSAVVRELFTDTNKGKILEFYKGRVKQFYDGHVEEVDFRRINNVIRRRTNSLINKQTRGQMPQYLEETTLHLRAPLSALSTNIFQADCSEASTEGRDGELYFIVLPSLRQRRLVPLPAAVWRSGFIAGYDPELDATAVSLGSTNQAISTIFVIPGQQGHSAPGDVLLRLEARLLNTTYIPETWTQLLRSMLPRPGLEIQLPRFLHKSVINSTAALKRLGLKELFQINKANLQGLNGIAHDLYFSDLVQVNEFSICGETQQQHTEIYPSMIEYLGNHNEHMRNFKYMDYLEEYDYDKYLSIPLPLRPRQARLPELPRLRFDRPFLFFVRHNPTGLLLHMGRFNPRLMT